MRQPDRAFTLDRHALTISGAYFVLALLWIWGSDWLAEQISSAGSVNIHLIQSYKGTAYVTATAVALYLAVSWNNRRQRRLAAEKRIVEEMLAVSQRLEALGTLAGTIVHDFNNVLAVIRGQTEVMKLEGYDASEVPHHVKAIETATIQAHQMVRELMLFMRDAPGELVEGDLGQQIRRIQPVLTQAVGRTVELTIDAPASVPTVRFDPSQVERTVLNLVMNARDALEQVRTRRINLSVATCSLKNYRSLFRPQASSGEYVQVRVQDNGCGISRENFARIFAPFFTTKAPGRGTGLGLTSVLRVMQSHCGWVEVSSTPGEGSTFTLYFPAVKAKVAPPEALTATAAHVETSSPARI